VSFNPNIQRWECECNDFGDASMQRNNNGSYVPYVDYARLKKEAERLKEIIDSFKTMPIIEGQSFNGWKLDEHYRLVSLVECLRGGSIEGAEQFTHKKYREFQKSMIENNAAKEARNNG